MPAICKNCDETIDESLDPPGKRLPCPKCGSKRRDFSFVAEAGQYLLTSGHLSMQHKRGDEIVGYSETERDGLAAHVAREESGGVSFGLDGRTPRGEQDTLGVCLTLVQRLNQDGATWADPMEGEGDIDCEFRCASHKDKRLYVQVVRAISDPNLWKKLANSGAIRQERRSFSDLAAELRASIEHKANEQAIPKNRRGDLVLALDANRLPAHALPATIKSFKDLHESWAGSLGFRAIWLVGPTVSLTSRLS